MHFEREKEEGTGSGHQEGGCGTRTTTAEEGQVGQWQQQREGWAKILVIPGGGTLPDVKILE